MKFVFGLSVLFSAVWAFGPQAMAETSYISCSNGNIDKLGDSYYQVDILEDGITFSPYEGSFTFDATEVAYESGTFTIVNKTTTVSAEGEESSVVINAILTLNPQGTLLNLAISEDRGAFSSYTMACVQM